MNQQMGLTEFFAMEAGEYLERIDNLVSGAVDPDRDELMRLTRALRGSALMANQQEIGHVTAALEDLTRAIKEVRVEWDERTKQTTIGAVDGLKILVRSVSTWGEAETARAKQLTLELASASGSPVPDPEADLDASVDTGTRAFVGREGAAVASIMNQTAKTLQREGTSAAQLDSVIRAMEPLRGLAALSELTPLPEYLDGVERVAAAAAHGGGDPNELALFLDVAARGFSKAAQEISTGGTAEPDSIEAREFTRRLGELLEVEETVVPIQALYYEDNGPHVIEQGTPQHTTGPLGQMELVAHGEHLCQVADALERAQWVTQREIRTIALKGTLRSLTAAKGSSLAAAVSAFATAAANALASGFLEQHKDGFIAQIRDAGHTLGGATSENDGAMVAKLAAITENLKTLPEGAELPTTQEPSAIGGPVSRPPAPSANVAVPPEPATENVAVPPEPSAVVDDNVIDLAASWSSFEELRDKQGDGDESLAGLLGIQTTEPPEPQLISIAGLCYSGPAALEQAHVVRDRIRSELTDSEWDAAVVTDLIDELLDLVELGVGQP